MLFDPGRRGDGDIAVADLLDPGGGAGGGQQEGKLGQCGQDDVLRLGGVGIGVDAEGEGEAAFVIAG